MAAALSHAEPTAAPTAEAPAGSTPVPTAVPAAVPAVAPARARRVGEVPVPRVRPLAEVLPGPRVAPVSAPDAEVRTRRAQDELDRLAAALRPVAARLLGAVADVLAGRRPVGHLSTLLTPAALNTLSRSAPTPGTGPVGARTTLPGPGTGSGPGSGSRPRPGSGTAVRGLRVCAVGPRAAEVAAVVHGRDRVRAVAARLERTDDGPADLGRWHVVALCPG